MYRCALVLLLLSFGLTACDDPAPQAPPAPSVPTESAPENTTIQCGHWAIFRVAQLSGLPIKLPDVLDILPTNPNGHSLLDISEALDSIGIDTAGKRLDWGELRAEKFPVVAHWESPAHFVVVTEVMDDYVGIYDEQGRRTLIRADEFQQKWSNAILTTSAHDRGGPRRVRRDGPWIQFPRLIEDVGNLFTLSAPVDYLFTYYNRGNENLVVESVQADCSCLSIEWDSEPIGPGGEGEIKLTYSVADRSGPFRETAYAFTNDALTPVIELTVSGNARTDVKVYPDSVDFGRIDVREAGRRFVIVRYTGDEPFDILSTRTDIPELRVKYSRLSQEKLAELWPGAVSDCPTCIYMRNSDEKLYRVELIYEIDRLFKNEVSGTVTIDTNINRYRNIVLQVSGEIVGFERAVPQSFIFGLVKPLTMYTSEIILESVTGDEFASVDVTVSDPRIRFELENTVGTDRVVVRLMGEGSVLAENDKRDVQLELRLGNGQHQRLSLPIVATMAGA